MGSQSARQWLSKEVSPLPWPLHLWAAPGLRGWISTIGALWLRKAWLLAKISIYLSLYTLLLSHPIPWPYEITRPHPWCMVAQDTMAWHKRPEFLVPALPKTPEEVSKVLTKYKMHIEAAWPLLSQLCQHAKALVLHFQGSRDRPNDSATMVLVEGDLNPTVTLGHSGKRSSHVWVAVREIHCKCVQ